MIHTIFCPDEQHANDNRIVASKLILSLGPGLVHDVKERLPAQVMPVAKGHHVIRQRLVVCVHGVHQHPWLQALASSGQTFNCILSNATQGQFKRSLIIVA